MVAEDDENHFCLPTELRPPTGSPVSQHATAAAALAISLSALLEPHLPLLELGPDRCSLLQSGVLDRLPPGWLAELRAPAPPPHADGSLGALLERCAALSLPRAAPPPPPPPRAVPRLQTLFACAKKRHELLAFGAAVASAAARSGAEGVLDAGAGQGRLCAHLSAAYGLPCLGLERDAAAVAAGRARAEWAAADRARRRQPSGAQAQELRAASCDAASLAALGQGRVLSGLHACGALGCALARSFVASPSAAALVYAPCCFQHDAEDCFPMSAALRRAALRPLSRRAREAAAQAAQPAYHSATSPAARDAMLRRAVGRFAVGQAADPGQMEAAAAAPYDPRRPFSCQLSPWLPRPLSAAEAAAADAGFERQFAEMAPLLRGWTTLRGALGGAVEALLLIDRTLFVHESGAAVALRPLFDPSVSPKSLAIVAVRESKSTSE